ncbi:MAG: alpha/beta hydrolase [Deltaproteobacteria bacterium]|jgi:fermentation-respiration switch protein FrsA (DUF1100 family)|nr:alpha/beta hydrolase [Deltaproteobacteria bacterium]
MLGKGFWDFLKRGVYLNQKGVELRELSEKTLVLRIVLSLVIGLALLVLILFIFKNKLIFFPTSGMNLTPASTGWEFEDVYIESGDGKKINGWYLPGPPDGNQLTVLLLHGNGGNMEQMLGRIMTYHKLDYGILAVDYQGFGRSEGSPSEEATYQDALAAWDFLTQTKGIKPQNIIIHGFSLGGGVATYLAQQKKEFHNPLILDSTFTKLRDAPAELNPIIAVLSRIILGNAYDSISRLKDIEAGVLLVFHSQRDEVVPYKLGRELFDAYDGGPKFFYELQGYHMEYTFNQGTYADAIYKHLSQMRPLVLETPEETGDPERVVPGSPLDELLNRPPRPPAAGPVNGEAPNQDQAPTQDQAQDQAPTQAQDQAPDQAQDQEPLPNGVPGQSGP